MEKKPRQYKKKCKDRTIVLGPTDTAIVFSDNMMSAYMIDRAEYKKYKTVDDIPISEIMAQILYTKLNDQEFCEDLLDDYFDDLDAKLRGYANLAEEISKVEPVEKTHKVVEEMTVPEVFDNINDILED